MLVPFYFALCKRLFSTWFSIEIILSLTIFFSSLLSILCPIVFPPHNFYSSRPLNVMQDVARAHAHTNIRSYLLYVDIVKKLLICIFNVHFNFKFCRLISMHCNECSKCVAMLILCVYVFFSSVCCIIQHKSYRSTEFLLLCSIRIYATPNYISRGNSFE